MTRGEDRSHALIVASVVELGHDLGLTIVAEDAQSLVTLAGFGCDVAQGYTRSARCAVDRLDAWLAARDAAAG